MLLEGTKMGRQEQLEGAEDLYVCSCPGPRNVRDRSKSMGYFTDQFVLSITSLWSLYCIWPIGLTCLLCKFSMDRELFMGRDSVWLLCSEILI